jgi:type VI secretion system secreted protein Hcp
MAIDVYLQIDGIAGESRDDSHRGWIECESVQWEVVQPKSASTSTSGGHTAERCIHRSIVIRKLSDLATPLLLQACSSGRTIPKAKLELMRADGAGVRIKYFEIALENVLIGDVAPEVFEGETMSEHLALTYSKVTWRYTRQKVGGGIAGMTAGGWDLATNRIA